jgi:quercetin dioxygenase-like cupin family protein
MRSIARITLRWSILVFFLAVCSTVFAAEDIVKVAPDHCKVLLDNENVRVIEYTAKPGDKVGMHSHPDHIIYVMKAGGKTKFTNEDGKTSERDLKVGEAIWVDAVTHATESMGTAESRLLIVEMKQ